MYKVKEEHDKDTLIYKMRRNNYKKKKGTRFRPSCSSLRLSSTKLETSLVRHWLGTGRTLDLNPRW
jgi:hypothetical protein